jgi:hypothetical protein
MKIISGGQTGVDRAALDAAISRGLDHGGSVPRGRRAEDGPIPARYTGLTELPTESYPVRTEKNVVDADATLVLTVGTPTEGTAFTVECAKKHGKPFLVVDMEGRGEDESARLVHSWFGRVRPGTLNVAGPRESKSPGIYMKAYAILLHVFKEGAGNLRP